MTGARDDDEHSGRQADASTPWHHSTGKVLGASIAGIAAIGLPLHAVSISRASSRQATSRAETRDGRTVGSWRRRAHSGRAHARDCIPSQEAEGDGERLLQPGVALHDEPPHVPGKESTVDQGTQRAGGRTELDHVGHVGEVAEHAALAVDVGGVRRVRLHRRLDPRHDALSPLAAGFPAGTVSGAPKIRAMQRIIQMRYSLLVLTRKLDAANQELKRLSAVDGLTGVANRRMFDETLRMRLEEARAQRHLARRRYVQRWDRAGRLTRRRYPPTCWPRL